MGGSSSGQRSGLAQSFNRRDLVSLSVSSVGPLFSVAATGGVMVANAGWWALPAIAVIAVPFLISSFVFRLLNRHFPHAGASYHWAARVVGVRASRFQAWVLILAYFTSIPPIILPAATYTIALFAPNAESSTTAVLAISAAWVGFALIPLLGGGRPTARITQAFLAVELAALLGLGILGALRWGTLHVPVHFGAPPVSGMLIVGVLAATILDGWEIDSYAAEESRRPRTDPGSAGIIGAFMALGFYAVLYPLMLAETPMHSLSGADNPLAVWGQRLLPHASWAILIPVLASTAGGLWLTSYILSRVLFAMGREGLLPKTFARVNHRQVPHVAVLATLGAALAVVAAQTLFTSTASFFALLLSGAGFFLTAEFFLDSTTALVFLTRSHSRMAERALPAHQHRIMVVCSALSTLLFAGFLIGFFVYGPKAIGGPIDYVLAIALVIGGIIALLPKKTTTPFVFQGQDLTEEATAISAS
jgi:amino acid transporter